MVFPGISGDSTNYYCVNAERACIANGYEMVVVNWRGMAGVPLKVSVFHFVNFVQSPNGYNGVDYSHIQEAIEYIYSEYCFDEDGNRTRRLAGLGISMGAGVLARYTADLGDKCKLDCCVSIGCHYDNKEAMKELRTNTYGAYDSIIAQGFTAWAIDYYRLFDSIAAKKYPERVIGEAVANLKLVTQAPFIWAKAAGMTLDQYEAKCNVTSILHKIKIPFFFFSTRDDPFFGEKVIPIGHCHDNILLGVLKQGGHCCNIEGGLLPTGCWWTKPSMVFLDHFMKEATANDGICN